MDAPVGFGLVNESKFITDADLQTMAAALEIQFQRDFCPAYNLPPLPVKAFRPLDKIPSGYLMMHFSDQVTDEQALGYHTDAGGNIYAEIEITILKGYGCGVLSTDPASGGGPDSISSVASHELLEMAFDPMASLWTPMKFPIDGTSMASEVADPVQESYYHINGVQVSDFVLPPYWIMGEGKSGVKYDYLGIITKPFEIAPGGYAMVSDSNGNVTSSFGARPPAKLRLDRRSRRKAMRVLNKLQKV